MTDETRTDESEWIEELTSATAINARIKGLTPAQRASLVRGMMDEALEQLKACFKDAKDAGMQFPPALDEVLLQLVEARAIAYSYARPMLGLAESRK